MKQKAFPDPTLADLKTSGIERLNNPDNYGMDLRDYFAIRIFQSLLAKTDEISMNDTNSKSLIGLKESKTAYALAHAMMEARDA